MPEVEGIGDLADVDDQTRGQQTTGDAATGQAGPDDDPGTETGRESEPPREGHIVVEKDNRKADRQKAQ
jgi:hypothetical protein